MTLFRNEVIPNEKKEIRSESEIHACIFNIIIIMH